MKPKKFTYTKTITLLSMIIFISCLAVAFLNEGDPTINIAAITVSGGIFGTNLVFYLKKAQVENTTKLKAAVFHSTVDEELRRLEGELILKQKYNTTNEDIEEVKSHSSIDDYSIDSMNDVVSTVDNALEDASSPIELQNY